MLANIDQREVELVLAQMEKAAMMIETGKAMMNVLEARLLEWGVLDPDLGGEVPL